MARPQNKQMNDLLMQAAFAPPRQRLIQIEACQALLRLIRPGREYPFEFVSFHLTGYRPRQGAAGQLIDYGTLVGDLGVYSENLSRSLTIRADQIGQKVYTAGQLARRFRVSNKTVSRWRRDGLIGRYMVFEGGTQRLGFDAASVEFFVDNHRGQVRSGRRFSRLSGAERQKISDRLMRWSQRRPGRRQEAIRRTARRAGRSVETVRGILVELESAGKAQFGAAVSGLAGATRRAPTISASEQRQICAELEGGKGIGELVASFGRSKSNVYRAIKLERARQLCELEISYVPYEQFGKKDWAEHMRQTEQECSALPQAREHKSKAARTQKPSSGSLEIYVKEILSGRVLTGRQEAFLFAKYNYLKFLAARLQEQIRQGDLRGRVISKARGYVQQAQEVKEFLIRSNLRLVVSVARKHARNDGDMLELISEGNVTLMNAVEKFDFSRGYKLSTYATWAIVKRFATLKTGQRKVLAQLGGEEMLEVAHDLRVADNRILEVEGARAELEEVMADTLEEREQVVVREHYGLSGAKAGVSGRRKTKSFREIGELLGLSKERIRQIELGALGKLRRILRPEQFDVLEQG